MSEEKTKKCKYCKTEIPADAKVCPQCRKKLKGGKLKWVVLIILVGAIIGAVAGESDSESDKSAATATSSEKKETAAKSKEEAAPIEYTAVSVNDMMSDLDSNAMGASDKYKGKYLEITGKLTNIDASGEYINLTADGDFEIIGVQCNIKNDEQKSKVASLTKGDTVTLKGKCTDVVTACASGSNSIGDALRAIQYGDLDVCVAGGTESCICPTGIAGFTALTALSTNEDPMTASRPFDQDRDGFVLGEGAGIVVLEELEHAKARGAKIYAELAGYGSTGDAYHITSPAENGEGAGMAMKLAMKEAGVAPEEVDYINAHGTSTHHNDLFETRAICYALGDAAENVVVNSTKSMIGHLLGAAGAVEFVVCVKSILDNFIHQTVGTKNVDPECGLNYAVGAPVEKEVNCVISNSLGFGGHNVSLLVKRFEE